MNEPLKRIRLKCRFEGDIRTVAITPESEYVELKKRLSSDYGFDVSLKYEDKDGDFIILSSQHDLDDLFIFGESETVNVNVLETVFLPHLQMKGSSGKSTVTSTMPPVKDWSRSGSGNSSSHSNMLRPIVTSSRVERFPNISDNSSPFRHESSNIRWKRAEMLGQGAFGVVYLGLNIDTGELMAVKQMATEEVSKRELSSLENEISLLRNLRHPNIVRYIGTELTQTSLSIFLEYVPGGSLKTLIDKFGRLEEAVAKSYTRQLLIGLEYLHRNGIAHRDIKGANCLVGNDGVIKLADFGNSKHWRASGGVGVAADILHPSQQVSSGDIKGTPSWMAPEIVRDQTGGISWKKADVWSLACTTLEMTTGKPPWSQFGNSVTILYHLACQDTLPEYPEPASVELVTFLNVCLQRDPAARPDITSLLLHSFVSSNILPSGQNAAGAAGWGAPHNHQLQSGGFQFSNRPSTVSSAVFSQWDSPHTSHTKQGGGVGVLRGPSDSSGRALIGSTVQTVVANMVPTGSPRGGHHRYSYSENHATMSVEAAQGSQDGYFPLILSVRDRSFRGGEHLGMGSELTDHLSRRPSLLLSASSTPRFAVDSPLLVNHQALISSGIGDRDPELSHERPQIGRQTGTSLQASSADDRTVSSNRSPLEELEEDTQHQAPDTPSRPGLMPPIIAKPKIRDRTGKRVTGGKKIRKKQSNSSSVSASVSADLPSDGEASVSLTQTSVVTAASRNRKVAASPLPNSPSKRAPSASSSQTSKDPKPILAASNGPVVPPLDMHASMSPLQGIVAQDSDDGDSGAARSPSRTVHIGNDDSEIFRAKGFVDCGVEIAGIASCVNTARLLEDRSSLSNSTVVENNEDIKVLDEEVPRQDVEKNVLPSVVDATRDQLEDSTARLLVEQDEETHKGETDLVTDAITKLSITCTDDGSNYGDALIKQQELFEPCLSPYLSQSVDGLTDQGHLLDMSLTLPTPSLSSKTVETSQSLIHAPLTRISSSRTNAGFTAKSVDLSLSLRSGGNTSSRQQLHSRSVPSEAVGAIDPLDMSCDSLEALQVLGLKPPRTALERDVSRTSTSNAPNRRFKRVSTADPQHFSECPDEDKISSSTGQGVVREEVECRVLGEPQLLDEHLSWVTRLRSPQRTALLVSASTDGTIRIWGPGESTSRAVLDTATFAQSVSKPETEKKTTTESDVGGSSARTAKVLNAWAEDSCDTVWAACSDGALRVWSGAEGRPLRLLKGHDEPVTAMEGLDASGSISGGVQQSSCLVSTGSADRTVRIWDVRAKKAQVFLFRGHGDTVLTLRWGEGGRSLISGGKDKTIRIWDTRAGRLRSTLEKHFGAVGAIRMFGDSTNSRQTTASVGGSSGAATSNISFFSAGRDSVLNAWTANGDCVFSQTAHRGAATFLSEINYSRQQTGMGGPLMTSLGADNIIKLWDLRRVRIISEIQSPVSAGNVSRAVWIGPSLVVSSSSGLVRQYDNVFGNVNASTDNGGGEWLGRDLASHGQASTDLIGTDSFLASSSRSGQILRWSYT